MVKNLFCLFLILQLFTHAQTWCPPGAVWHHTLIPVDAVNPKTGVVEDKYVGDTLISGKTCKKIIEIFTGKASPLSPVSTNTNNNRTTYSYLENGVLFVYKGGNFDTVVNFNAAIGDKWLRNRLTGACNGRRVVTVIDTNHIIVNNYSLKRIVTTYSNTYTSNNNTYTSTVTDEIIERIMTTNKYIFPMYCEMNNVTDYYNNNGNLICYEDGKFPLYKVSNITDCDYATSLHELSAQGNGISIYPNPAFDHVDIEILKPGTFNLLLTDVLSKNIIHEKAVNGKYRLDIGNLKNGIYFLSLSSGDGATVTKKIVKD